MVEDFQTIFLAHYLFLTSREGGGGRGYGKLED